MQQNEIFYEDEIDLRDIVKAFSRHKTGFLRIVLAGIILAGILVLSSPKAYKANSMLLVTPLKVKMAVSGKLLENIVKGNDKGVIDLAPTISLETHQELLVSNTILDELYHRLIEKGLIKEGDFDLADFKKQLSVELKKDTDVLILNVKAMKPDLAVAIANEWAGIYMKYNQDLLLGEFQGARDFISEQFDLAKTKYLSIRDDLDSFDVREGLSIIEDEYAVKTDQLTQYFKKITDLKLQLALKEKELEQVNNRLKSMEKDGMWIGVLALEDKLSSGDLDDLSRSILKISSQFNDASEKLLDLQNKTPLDIWQSERDKLIDRIADSYMALFSLKGQMLSVRNDLANDVRLNRFVSAGMLIPEQISGMDLWHVLSLLEGYNFFTGKYEGMLREIDELNSNLSSLREKINDAKKVIREYSIQVKVLIDKYNQFRELYKNNVATKTKLEIEIAELKPQIAYLTDLADKLQKEIEDLNVKLVEKRHKKELLKADFNLYESTYKEWADRLVETRIAKAMQLGDVKLVSQAVVAEGKRPFNRVKAMIFVLLFVFVGMLYVFIAEALSEPEKEKNPDGK